MTLPKKASRSIEVNGRQYRWMVRKTKASMGKSPMLRLTVQDEETGELLQRDFPDHHPSVKPEDDHRFFGAPANTITPADVTTFIHERFPQP
jgi:hypothetical protein